MEWCFKHWPEIWFWVKTAFSWLFGLHAVVCVSYFSGQDLSIKSKGRLEKKISAWQSCAILHTEPQQSCLTACLRLRLASSIRCQ